MIDSGDYTGFADGSSIDIAYDWATRTVTLTGDLSYYYRGVPKELTSPWTSVAHAATDGGWFLSSTDGTSGFTWSQSPWSFEDVQAAYINYQGTSAESFGVRETHGLIPSKVHREFHDVVGTYHSSGGKLTAGTYTIDSALDASTTPGFDAATVHDEDLTSVVPVWTQGTYTTMYVSGTTSIYDVAASFPFTEAGSYMQLNDPSAGTMTDGIADRWYNIYQIIIPTTSDSDSETYRMVMLQPQVEFTSLVAAQAESTQGLELGSLVNLSSEFILYSRISYNTATGHTNTGKCVINGVSYVIGTKLSQVSIDGVSSSNHAGLSNLGWNTSGHIGDVSKLAGFDGAGVATYYDIGTGSSGTSVSAAASLFILTASGIPS